MGANYGDSDTVFATHPGDFDMFLQAFISVIVLTQMVEI